MSFSKKFLIFTFVYINIWIIVYTVIYWVKGSVPEIFFTTLIAPAIAEIFSLVRLEIDKRNRESSVSGQNGGEINQEENK